ncbi:hypothetical protein C8J57DRAFT_1619122 [Mycena rebaudengoi]|nr:hypothetical protein C8J57DRAFT_1619122 [Mycena rebaudengoi]
MTQRISPGKGVACRGVRVTRAEEAHRLFMAALDGRFPILNRGLSRNEKDSIRSGDIYVWETTPFDPFVGGGIHRFQDGISWLSRTRRGELSYSRRNLASIGANKKRQVSCNYCPLSMATDTSPRHQFPVHSPCEDHVFCVFYWGRLSSFPSSHASVNNVTDAYLDPTEKVSLILLGELPELKSLTTPTGMFIPNGDKDRGEAKSSRLRGAQIPIKKPAADGSKTALRTSLTYGRKFRYIDYIDTDGRNFTSTVPSTPTTLPLNFEYATDTSDTQTIDSPQRTSTPNALLCYPLGSGGNPVYRQQTVSRMVGLASPVTTSRQPIRDDDAYSQLTFRCASHTPILPPPSIVSVDIAGADSGPNRDSTVKGALHSYPSNAATYLADEEGPRHIALGTMEANRAMESAPDIAARNGFTHLHGPGGASHSPPFNPATYLADDKWSRHMALGAMEANRAMESTSDIAACNGFTHLHGPGEASHSPPFNPATSLVDDKWSRHMALGAMEANCAMESTSDIAAHNGFTHLHGPGGASHSPPFNPATYLADDEWSRHMALGAMEANRAMESASDIASHDGFTHLYGPGGASHSPPFNLATYLADDEWSRHMALGTMEANRAMDSAADLTVLDGFAHLYGPGRESDCLFETCHLPPFTPELEKRVIPTYIETRSHSSSSCPPACSHAGNLLSMLHLAGPNSPACHAKESTRNDILPALQKRFLLARPTSETTYPPLPSCSEYSPHHPMGPAGNDCDSLPELSNPTYLDSLSRAPYEYSHPRDNLAFTDEPVMYGALDEAKTQFDDRHPGFPSITSPITNNDTSDEILYADSTSGGTNTVSPVLGGASHLSERWLYSDILSPDLQGKEGGDGLCGYLDTESAYEHLGW